MDRYGDLVDDPGEAAADGESWADATERLRGQHRPLHPLVYEVFDDV